MRLQMFRMTVAAVLLLTLALPPAAAQLQVFVSFTPDNPTYGITVRVFCNEVMGMSPYTYNWTGPPGVDLSNTESDGSIIVLSVVDHSHRGDYNCTVMDGNGDSASDIGTLVVVPAITEDPVDQVVLYEDGTASFNCTANGGTPPPSLSFMWDSDPDIDTTNTMVVTNPDGTNTGILTIVDISSDCGDYAVTCDVIYSDRDFTDNEQSVASATLTVVPAIVEGPLDQQVSLGADVTLNCTARGGTALVFTWTGPPNMTLPDPDTSDNGDGSTTTVLTLTEVDINYSGNYTCQVGCTMGAVETASATANLDVVPPAITVTPMSQTESRGASVSFTCNATGVGDLTLEWSTTAIDSSGLPAAVTESDGDVSSSFTLTNVTGTNGGQYTCELTTSGIGLNATASLYIIPEIVDHPEDLLTRVGENRTLECVADGFPELDYIWQKFNETAETGSGVGSGLQLGSGMDLMGRYMRVPNATSSVLSFDPVEFGDEGEYRCIVSNIAGRDASHDALVTVSPEGSVSVSPLDQGFDQGVNVVFTCSAMGGPDNSFQWLKDGTDLNVNSSMLSVNQITVNDGGVYTCIVSNAAGNDSASSTLFVNPELRLSPNDTLTTNGSVVMLMCDVEAFPDPAYQWFYSGGPIAGNIMGENSNMLVFNPVLFGNEGTYYCNATSNNMTIQSDSAILTVSPSVRVDPEIEIAEIGENITFDCSVLGGPNNTFLWQLGGMELEEMSATLTVTNIDTADGGEYTCTVSNAAGNDSASATLYISPQIQVQPMDIFTENGSFVNFTCQAIGFPDPEYRWEMVEDSDSLVVSSGDTLEFNPAVFGDEGFYRCVAFLNVSSIMGMLGTETASDLAVLTISPEGSVEASPQTINSRRGSTEQFNCSAQGGPENAFTWTRLSDGAMVSNESELVVEVNGATDGSSYECSVENDAGNETAMVTLNVAPEIEDPPSDLNVTRQEANITLSCTATGFPVPSITWRHNSTEIDASDSADRFSIQQVTNMTSRTIMSTLTTVSAAMTNDSGEYECNVTSTVGEYAAVVGGPVTVLVQDTPEQPQNVTGVALSSTAISLTWVEPHDNNAPILGYRVRYLQPSFLNGTGEELVVETEMATITDLHPGVTYNFTVIAFNDIGNSTASEEADVRTDEETPDAPPMNVQAMVDSSTTILVTWEPVPEMNRNGDITHYEVEFNQSRFTEIDMSNLTETEGPVLMLLLPNLQEDVEYQIRVRAYTSIGPGPYSFAVSNRTFEDVPDAPPQNVTAAALSSTEIRVSWEEVPAINQNGEIILYEIQYTPLMTFNGTIGTNYLNATNGSVLQMTLTGLQEFVEYNITVRAYTSVGPGPFSPVASDRTFEDEPAAAPENIQTVTLSSTEIRVSWTPPPEIDQNGIITVYEVEYEPLMTFGEMIATNFTNTTTGSMLEITLNGLEENVEYNIRVRAYTSVGPGPFSTDVSNTTFEDVPAVAPPMVDGMSDSPTSITVSWDELPLIDQNGMITQYEVEFNQSSFDEATLSNSTFTEMTMADLEDLEEFVNYSIRVRAFTDVGPGPFSTAIVIETQEATPSAAPENVQMETLSSTEILVSWAPPPEIDQNGVIVDYEVEYDPQETFGGMIGTASMDTGDGSVLEITLSGLEENVEYSIRVRAYTSEGFGPYSPAVSNRTFEDVPAVAPPMVDGMSDSPTSIIVTWEELPLIYQNGMITQYEVEFNQSSFDEATLSNSTFTEMTMADLEDLEEFVNYSIRVRAFTDVGPGPFSTAIVIETQEATPSAAPENVQMETLSSTEILVSWAPPPEIDQNGVIVDYEVEYDPQETFGGMIGTASMDTGDGSVLEITLSGLEENVEYSIRVRAYTSEGFGPYSPAVSNRTFEDVPAVAPPMVDGMSDSPTSIIVTWEELPLIYQNGMITQYEVEFNQSSFDEATLSNSTFTEMTMADLEDLEEFVNYSIRVRAFTDVGPGPFSTAIVIETQEATPSAAPENVQTETLSSTEILVSWAPPPEIDQNGVIVDYEVEYDPQETFGGMIGTASMDTGDGSVLEITLSGLEENVEYSIRVRAYTSEGFGPYSPAVLDTTFEDVPAVAPPMVDGMSDSPTSIIVTWEELPLIEQNGMITQYEVEFNQSRFNEATLSNSTFTEMTMADLEDLEEFVNYSIRVRAFTDVGPGPFSTAIVIETQEATPSAPPENVQTVTLSSTEIRVYWDPPPEIDQNGVIVDYEVEYDPQETFGGLIVTASMDTGDGSVLEITLNGLEENVEYSIRVRAYTSEGFGPYSTAVSNRTFEDEPAAPPENVQTVTLSSTEIRVSWAPPPEVDQNGVIVDYEVEYDPQETFGGTIGTASMDTGDGSVLEITLSGLQEDVEYSIRVRAYTSEGSGPYSTAVSNRTFEDVPAVAPPMVDGMSDSPTSIIVTWEELPLIYQNGMITQYEVEFNQSSFDEATLSNSTFTEMTMADLEDLEEFVNYSIRVRAFTDVGPGPFSTAIVIETQEAPPSAAPENVQTETLSSTEILVSWDPPPEIDQNGVIVNYEVEYDPQETFGGTIVTASVDTGDGSVLDITLNGLEENVEYSIRVRAYTSEGSGPYSTAVLSTTFEDVPAVAPPNVEGADDSPTSILVTWDELPPIDQNGIITQYEVEFNQSRFDEATLSNSTFTEMTRVDLEGLEEFVNYSIQVRAFTSAGPGPFSTAIVVETQEAAPQEAPQNVTAITLSTTEIFVSWTPPPEISHNGIIIHYDVEYDPQTTFDGMIETDLVNTSDGSVLNITLSGLEENVEYRIRVRAHTSVGPGPYSFVVSNTTFEDEPDAPPQNVAATTLSSTEIRVSWEEVPAINQNGEIILYEIMYTPLMTFSGMIGTDYVNTTNGSVLQMTLTGLQEFVEYNITVRAYTSVGPGPFSPVVSNTTLQDAPAAAPENVQTETLSSTEIRVSWTPPPEIDQNGVITVYEVRYEPLMTFGGMIATNFTNTTTGSMLEIVLRELEENVEYNISVRAYTSVGPGPYSTDVSNTTFENAPAAAPENVQTETLSSTEIRVSWAPPPEIDQNGIIILYEIQYTPLMTFGGAIGTNSVNTDNGAVLEMTLTGLQEFVEYNITVRAYTSVGPGPFSPVVSDRTFEDEPAAAPENVQTVTLSSTEIRVSWAPPPEIDQNGVIVNYEVEYDPQETFGGMIVTASVDTGDGSVLEITLNGLEENVEYSIRVRAYTSEGFGPYSSAVLNTTFEDIPNASPQNVTAETLSPTEILVSWEEVPAINQSGEIILYEIQYTQVMGTDYVNTTNGSMLRMILTGLVGFVDYSISVRAYTSVGPGPFSPVVSIQTFNDIPLPPEQPPPVREDAISSDSATLSWVVPQGGNVTNFTVNLVVTETLFQPMGRRKRQTDISAECVIGGENRDITVPGDQTSLNVTDLTPFTAYEFQVQAVSVVGLGNFSEPQNFSSSEDVPSEPLNLEVRYINSTALEVTWDRPLCDYGIRRGYTVTHDPLPSSLDPQGVQGLPDSPQNLSADATSLTITQLTPNTNYSVTVCAFTSVGCGNASVVVNQTDEDAPGAISNLEVTSNRNPDGPPNTVNVDITWDGPSRRNGLYGYNLTYSAEQLDPYPESRRQIVSIQTASPIGNMQGRFTISDSNALPFANFSVTVFAFNLKRGMDVAGPPSSETHRTLAIESSGVTALRAVATSPESIRVEWDLPRYPNGPLQYYMVYYRPSDTVQQPPIDSSGYRQQRVNGSSTTMTEITGLEVFTNYSIHVQPFGGENGETLPGAIDIEILQRTNSTVPDEPPTLPPTDEPTQGTTRNTIFVYLPPPDQITTGFVIFYGIVVVETRGMFANETNLPDQSTFDDAGPYDASVPDQTFYITAAWGSAASVPETFIIGTGSRTVVRGVDYLNVGLKDGTEYAVFYRVELQSDNGEELVVYSDYVITRTATPSGIDAGGLAAGLVVGILFLVVVVTVAVVLAILWWRKRKYKNLVEGEVAFTTPMDVIYNPSVKPYAGTPTPVPLNAFGDHVKRMHSNDDYLFSEEYSSVEPQHTTTTEATFSASNTAKNRYANIPAYDHSRVRLKEIAGKAGSDYINANFIHGYRQHNGYIATQGPVPDSVSDFWRMMWEQGSATIIMLTNLEERQRIKCHQYWPEEKSSTYGVIRVFVQEVLVLADYTIRTFSVQKDGSREERIVTQYHYTVWPDHGVPEYPTSILHFVRKVSASAPTNAGPMVVHCSAGVGRTGTFITLDAQLKRIKAEGNVDIFGFVREMRRQRCSMVQTEAQYVFIHDALLEAIECGVMEVAARNLREQYRMLGLIDEAIGKTGLQIEFDKLDITIHHSPTKNSGTLTVNKPKNRYTNSVPYDQSRCRLSFIPGVEGSDYINASFVDGYHKRKAFIATQAPLPDTAEDFWRLVWEQKCATIVMITKLKEGGRVRCHRYWPTSGAENYGQFQVILHTVNEYPDYTVRECKIVDTKDGSSLPVKQLQYTGWPEEGVPDAGSGLIDLIGQVEKWQRSSGERPIVIHCSGGTGRTGTFVAVSILLERLKTEGVVDVFHTVRGLRLQRPGMVRTVEQYEFCYKTVLEYLDSFELYANFK